MAKKRNLGKVRRRSGPTHLFGKKNSFLSKLLFFVAVAVVAYFVHHAFQRYENAIPKRVPRPSATVIPRKGMPTPASDYVEKLPPVAPLERPDISRLTPQPLLQPPLPSVTVPEKAEGLGFRKRHWTQKPKLVFVIDDIGHNRNNERLFRLLNDYVNYAILPQLRYTRYFSSLSRETKADVILHQPMEASSGIFPGPGLIRSEMDENAIVKLLDQNLNEVPARLGINNHMGSLGSADPRIMEIVLRELKRRGLFFLDSRTTPQFASQTLGPQLNFPFVWRDIFLDNVDEPGAIRAQIRQLTDIARKQGYAIAIGHDRYHTLNVLYEDIPELEKEGFQIVSLSDMFKHKTGLH